MSKKKEVREKFRLGVFERDNYTCKVCNIEGIEETLDAHHITDRSKMPNGGYVKENGITVHKIDCHFKVEKFHIFEGLEWEEGLHPDNLYKMIGSSYEEAVEKSELL